MAETVEQAANVFAFAPEETAVNAQEADGEAPTEETEQIEETGVATEADGDADRLDGKSGKDIGKAFSAERKRIEEKYQRQLESDPFRQLGKLMADDLAETQNIPAEEAVKKARDNFLAAVAKRDGISQRVARKIYGEQADKVAEKTAESEAQRIAEEVKAAPKPAGFDPEIAYNDNDFLQLLEDGMPAAAAIRVWTAERKAANARQDVAERIVARNGVPQMTRPNMPVTPKTDWLSVDKETFEKEKKRRQREY